MNFELLPTKSHLKGFCFDADWRSLRDCHREAFKCFSLVALFSSTKQPSEPMCVLFGPFGGPEYSIFTSFVLLHIKRREFERREAV